jgi:hypothetical protein
MQTQLALSPPNQCILHPQLLGQHETQTTVNQRLPLFRLANLKMSRKRYVLRAQHQPAGYEWT